MPTYEPNDLSGSVSVKSFIENKYPKFDSLFGQTVGQPFSVLAVMIDIMYDPIVFLSESEYPGIKEFVEAFFNTFLEIHFVVHGTSSLSDQLAIVPERVAEQRGCPNL